MRLRILVSLLALAATVAATMIWRHFPPSLAILSGVGVGALTFSTLSTAVRLREHFRPEP